MKIKILNNEADYNQALKRMEKIFDSEPTSKEGEEAELLALLIEDYEDRIHPIHVPDPITAIKIRMEEMELKQKDLIGSLAQRE